MMIDFLLFTRACIIGWTWFALSPVELTFDAIETELERRGVSL
jgi:hypothetical protein